MAEERVQRRLAAILAADVVGYSRLIEADEEGTRARLRSLQAELIDPRIAADGGRIFKTTGDGVLVEFPSAIDAVRNALGIQATISRRNAEIPKNAQITFRVGINVGDVIVEDEDIHGDGVNLAARLEELCDPGGVYVSGTVYDQASGKLDASFEYLGEHNVKNLVRPVRVYRVASSEAGPSRSEARVDALFRLPSIAVLPFENMSGDSDQEYFSDGITEDLITALSRVRQFRVVARNSTYSYKGQSSDIRAVARELGVRYVIEGSVRKASNRIRLTAQLIDGSTGEHLWSQRYDRDLDDIFAVQDELTRTVVGALEPELGKAETQRARSKNPESLDAWDLYQQGMWHLQRRTREEMTNARGLFQRSIELNRDFAPAISSLANTTILEIVLELPGVADDALDEAVRLARRAVEIDDADASGWCWLGRAHLFAHMLKEALSETSISMDLDPCFAPAYYTHGAALMFSGNAPDSIPYFQTALSLSPGDAWVGSIMARLAEAYLHTGQYEEAVQWSRHPTLRTGPGRNLWPNYLALASALGHLGRQVEAKHEVAKLDQVRPGITCSYVRDNYQMVDPQYFRHLLDGLGKAGLPE